MARQKRDAASRGGGFTPQSYLDAARERLDRLPELFDSGDYVLSLFWSGVAVECLLRAYRLRIDPTFDERHDLPALSKSARFDFHLPPSQRERVRELIYLVNLRWSSTDRFRPAGHVRARLKRLKLDRGIKGDFLKENARRMIWQSTEIVLAGAAAWKNSKPSGSA